MLGGTLLWADHYLANDRISESLITDYNRRRLRMTCANCYACAR